MQSHTETYIAPDLPTTHGCLRVLPALLFSALIVACAELQFGVVLACNLLHHVVNTA